TGDQLLLPARTARRGARAGRTGAARHIVGIPSRTCEPAVTNLRGCSVKSRHPWRGCCSTARRAGQSSFHGTAKKGCPMPAPVTQVLAFIPNLLVAAAILAVFGWLAGFVRNLVTGALQSTMPNANTIGVLAYAATFGFGLIAAATQIGVATALIDILFAGVVAGLALAFGLAFGLGGRDEAAQVWHQLRGSARPHDVGEPEMRHGNGRPRVESEPEP